MYTRKKSKTLKPVEDKTLEETEAPRVVDAPLTVGSRRAVPTLDQLPPRLHAQLKNFIRLAPLGLKVRHELLVLAHAAGYQNTAPLSTASIASTLRHFLTALSFMELGDEAGVEDLLELTAETKYIGGREYCVLRNPHMDRYREAERAACRPGFKRPGYDSSSFARAVSAVCAVARFNGEFVLPAQFRKHYPVRLDHPSRAERRHTKKMMLSRRWVDAEIRRLKAEFDAILRRRSFLTDWQDLRLCLFLPMLIAVRYLGWRQRDLLTCRVGTNVFFGPEGSIRFHFSDDVLRPHNVRDFTLSQKNHGVIEEVHLLLSVLTDYKHRFLDVLRSEDPKQYSEMMGDYFFARAAARERWLIEAHAGRSSSEGRPDPNPSRVGRRFMSDADALMREDGEGGDLSAVSLEAVRLLAYLWAYETLNMSVEEIARFFGHTLESVIRLRLWARPVAHGGQH